MSRETITQALVSLLWSATFTGPVMGVTGWANAGDPMSRRLVLFDSPGLVQPSMYLVSHDEEDARQGRGVPVRRIAKYSVVCYCRAEQGTVGDTLVNYMLEGIEGALAPTGRDTPDNVQTLGGLVYKVEIRGTVFRDPGDVDCQAMLIVPIEVMIP